MDAPREGVLSRVAATGDLGRREEDNSGMSKASMLLRERAQRTAMAPTDEASQPSIVTVFRIRLQEALRDSQTSFLLDFVQAIMGIMACAVYVASVEIELAEPSVPVALTAVEVIIAIVFLADYLLRLWVAPDRITFVARPSNIIDALSILPILAIATDAGATLGFVRVLRALRLTRILRAFRALNDQVSESESFSEIENSLRRQVLLLVLSLMSFAFISAGTHSLSLPLIGSRRALAD